MSYRDWTCPGADEGGFITFEELKERTSHYSLQEFSRLFPLPGLLVVYQEEPGQEVLDPTDRGVQLLTVSIRSRAILRYLSKVAFLSKRPGNPFGHLISIGRSKNNDITIGVDSVSKVHGYFVADGDDWFFTDHGSTNGSRINDRVLERGDKYPLRDGDLLHLGLEVAFDFLGPRSLYMKTR